MREGDVQLSLATARVTAVLLLLGLPLASGWLAGFPAGFAELPPRTVYIHPPAFSAILYGLLVGMLVMAGVFFLRPQLLGFDSRQASVFTAFDWAIAPGVRGRFPLWGWAGSVLIALSWPAAWFRPEWLGPVTDHTFFPLWLGYILTLDALIHYRTGTSPAAARPVAWLAWFPASAATWWYFELLNRFIQNWLYLGVDQFTPLRYILGSTLAFSTVIPSVLTTAALLGTFGRFRHGFVYKTPPTGAHRPWWALVVIGASGLALIPWFPVTLFALIWLAPLLVVSGLLELTGRATGPGHLLRGDWGPVATLAAAALVCGVFWELWNIHAMPKWIYQVPWLNRFKLFEMPLVGYLGYLPFGPTCWAFWLLLSASRRSAPEAPRAGKSRLKGIGASASWTTTNPASDSENDSNSPS